MWSYWRRGALTQGLGSSEEEKAGRQGRGHVAAMAETSRMCLNKGPWSPQTREKAARILPGAARSGPARSRVSGVWPPDCKRTNAAGLGPGWDSL